MAETQKDDQSSPQVEETPEENREDISHNQDEGNREQREETPPINKEPVDLTSDSERFILDKIIIN